MVFCDGKLGDLTLTPAVVQDEQGQAGVAQQAPGLGRLQLPGQGQEGRVLQPPEVQHQRGQGREEGQHVVTPRTTGGREVVNMRLVIHSYSVSSNNLEQLNALLQYPTV